MTVVLNGDGGDESFAGYPRSRPALAAGSGPRGRCTGRRPRADRLEQAPGAAGRNRAVLRTAGTPRLGALSALVSCFTEPEERRSTRRSAGRAVGDSADGVRDPYAASGGRPRWPCDCSAWTRRPTCPTTCWSRWTRAPWLSSLEARSPLLDHVFMEMAARAPVEREAGAPHEQAPVQGRVRSWLPDEVIDRRKMGFSVPIAAWFRGELRPEIRARLLDPASALAPVVCASEVARLLEEHLVGRRDHAWPLGRCSCFTTRLARARHELAGRAPASPRARWRRHAVRVTECGLDDRGCFRGAGDQKHHVSHKRTTTPGGRWTRRLGGRRPAAPEPGRLRVGHGHRLGSMMRWRHRSRAAPPRGPLAVCCRGPSAPAQRLWERVTFGPVCAFNVTARRVTSGPSPCAPLLVAMVGPVDFLAT